MSLNKHIFQSVLNSSLSQITSLKSSISSINAVWNLTFDNIIMYSHRAKSVYTVEKYKRLVISNTFSISVRLKFMSL